MIRNEDTLFGRFTGQSKLKQGNRRIRLTPEQSTGERRSNPALLTEAVELEGSFGIVVGNLDGNTFQWRSCTMHHYSTVARTLGGIFLANS